MACIFYIGSFLSIVLFTTTIQVHIYIIYFTVTLLGFFMTGYLSVGFELTSEITFPEPEGLSTGLLNTSGQTFGLIFTYVQGIILVSYGSLYSNIFVCLPLLIGSVLTGKHLICNF